MNDNHQTVLFSKKKQRKNSCTSKMSSEDISDVIVASTKEKRNWLHSLTRRKKAISTNSSSSGFQNNNNEPQCTTAGRTADGQRKDKNNVFQRIRRKLGFHLSSFKNCDAMENGTTDATYEFLAHPRIEPTLPFTHDYIRFIRKKWLDKNGTPNSVMYTACSEMLNQVWYWGEISRRDAQRQLSDKPTGSFLVRDSETTGSQFTLSFRIVNVTLHYRLEYRDQFWHFEELKYISIVEMIQDILHRCTNHNFVCFVKVPNEMQPPFPVILKYPLSRYLNLPTLQDLCRRVLQRHMDMTQLSLLPVPAQMLEYLSVERELVFQS